MRDRQPTIADAIIAAHALLDGRYRLDTLIRRSQATTVHLATHRNGSSAWLKLPISTAHGEAIALEARIANAIGSALSVRDDGVTREGLPYLVLDPPDAESLAVLLTRARAGKKLSIERTMRAGDSLATVVSALHAMGYVTSGLAPEDILVFANDEVALLDLHAVSAASPAGILADNAHVIRVLSALVADMDSASFAPVSEAVHRVLCGRYGDVAVLQAAWRFAFPAPIKSVTPARSPSVGEVGSAPRLPLAAPETPLAVTVPDEPEGDGSRVEYLRSGPVDPSVAASLGPTQQRPVMYDPLSRLAEMPRLVQASLRPTAARAPARRSRGFLAAVIGLPALVLVVTVTVLVSSSGPPSARAAASAAAATTHAPSQAPAARAPVPAPTPTPAPSAQANDFELVDESSPAVAAAKPPAAEAPPEGTAVLRTDAAPAGRSVYLDGKIIGETPLVATVECGTHWLQMMAGAPAQSITLPCGGERVIRYDRGGHWSVKSQ